MVRVARHSVMMRVLITENAIEEIPPIGETLEPTPIVMGAKGRTSLARHHARAPVLAAR